MNIKVLWQEIRNERGKRIMLNFEEFKVYVEDRVRMRMDGEIEDVVIKPVMKNNDKALTGLIITREDTNVSPTIYLEPFFDQYLSGTDVDIVIDDICDMYRVHVEQGKQFSGLAAIYNDYEQIKERVFPCVINTASNKERLKDLVHNEVEDLSIIYKVFIGELNEGQGSITVRNDHLKIWDITAEELSEQAMKNQKELRPVVARSMIEIMRSMLGEDFADAEEAIGMDNQMMVLSNELGLDGAAAILDKDSLDKIVETFGEDVFILPSSVHEIICVPQSVTDVESLHEMVMEVNSGHVAPEERLSDHVYSYDSATRVLSLADTTLEELKVAENMEHYDVECEKVAQAGAHRK